MANRSSFPIPVVAIALYAVTAVLAIVLAVLGGATAYVLGQVFGAVVMGLVMGCIPYYYGKRKGKEKLAHIALATCTLCGLILGIILALPVALAYTAVMAFSGRE